MTELAHAEARPTEARLLHMVFPDHTNHLGTLFGGQALAWMDMAAFIVASRWARTTVVTARSEQVDFNQPIHKGDLVLLGLASSNRDPALYSEPDRFDITRSTTQKSMTFGFGPHHCVGSGLARRELEIVFEMLLTELPGLRLEPGRLPQLKCQSLFFRGFESLHVRW